MNDEEIKDFWERSHRSHEAFAKIGELCEKYAAGTDPKQLADASNRALAAIDADFKCLLGDGQGNKWP